MKRCIAFISMMVIGCLCVSIIYAQAPVNDECSGAIPVTTQPYAGACSATVSANTNGATHSTPDPSCVINKSINDTWYTFTASSKSVLLRFSNAMQTNNGTGTQLGYALYANNCPAATATIACSAGFGFISGAQTITGLTIGTTYYLRLFGSNPNTNVIFDFCLQDIPPPPPNDECSSAIPITVSPFNITCISAISANTFGATQSSPNPSCTGTLNDDDTWYRFQATTSTVMLRAFNAISFNTGTGTQVGFAFYGGSCPSGVSTIQCSNFVTAANGYAILTNLTPGTDYFLRFWSINQLDYVSFEFCIQAVPQPANDECTNAIAITTQPVGTICNNGISATTVGATPSTPDPACSGGFNDDDTWYTFIARTGVVRINFSNARAAAAPSGINNLGYALHDSPCPSTTTALGCKSNIGNGSGSELVGGLVPGRQYYLRFYSFGTANYIAFDFCVVDIDVPLNDECVNAVNLAVSNSFCTSPVAGTLLNSTDIAGLGLSTCIPTTTGEDVWYKATVPSSGNLIVQTSAVNTQLFDVSMEAYSGSCGTLSLITCNDNGNPGPPPSDDHPRISLTGRAPGEVIYLRVLNKFNINNGPFMICAWDSSAIVPVSAGGNCVSGIPATINATNGNHYMWVPVFDASGNIMAEIYAAGNNLGAINSSLFVNSSGTVRNVNGQYYLDRNLALTPAVNGPAKLRLYFTSDEWAALTAADPSIPGLGALKINKVNTSCQALFSGSPVIITQDTVAAYGNNYYLEFDVNSFSSFFVDGRTAALPLKFLSFTAQTTNDGTLLQWIVVKDESIDGFEIEQSKDGRTFTTVTEKKRSAFDKEYNNTWQYTLIDHTIYSYQPWYRVKMKDINGKILYSQIIRGGNTPYPIPLKVYPNPSPGYIFVQPDFSAPGIEMELLDISGAIVRRIKDVSFRNGTIMLDIQAIPAGMYVLKVKETGNGIVHRVKVVKY